VLRQAVGALQVAVGFARPPDLFVDLSAGLATVLVDGHTYIYGDAKTGREVTSGAALETVGIQDLQDLVVFLLLGQLRGGVAHHPCVDIGAGGQQQFQNLGTFLAERCVP